MAEGCSFRVARRATQIRDIGQPEIGRLGLMDQCADLMVRPTLPCAVWRGGCPGDARSARWGCTQLASICSLLPDLTVAVL